LLAGNGDLKVVCVRKPQGRWQVDWEFGRNAADFDRPKLWRRKRLDLDRLGLIAG
jgi:hypothetical protein